VARPVYLGFCLRRLWLVVEGSLFLKDLVISQQCAGSIFAGIPRESGRRPKPFQRRQTADLNVLINEM